MPKSHTHDSTTTSRRSLFAAAAPAALALAGASAAVATPEAAPSFYSTLDAGQKVLFDRLRAIVEAQAAGTWVEPAHPDAELIAHCAAFDVLERRYQATFAVVETDDEWDVADAAADLIRAEQDPIVDAITACRPSTLAGFRAVAQSLALWDLELLKPAHGGGYVNDRLSAHLVGSLLGQAVA